MPDNTIHLSKVGGAIGKGARKAIKRYKARRARNAAQYEKTPKAVFTTKAEALSALKSPHFRDDAKVKKTTAYGLFNLKSKR
jgi:hypothetical protein